MDGEPARGKRLRWILTGHRNPLIDNVLCSSRAAANRLRTPAARILSPPQYEPSIRRRYTVEIRR